MKVKVIKIEKDIAESDIDFDLKAEKPSEKTFELVNRLRATNSAQGTKSAKTRSEVLGKAAKPWRQKGTGRARQGSRKGPHFVGGGVAHGPRPYAKRIALNKKVKSLALKNLLAAHTLMNSLNFVSFEKNVEKKAAYNFLNNCENAVIISNDNSLVKKFGNVDQVVFASFKSLSAVDIISRRNVYIDLSIKEDIEKLLK